MVIEKPEASADGSLSSVGTVHFNFQSTIRLHSAPNNLTESEWERDYDVAFA